MFDDSRNAWMCVYLEILLNAGSFSLNKVDDGIIISFLYFYFEILCYVLVSFFNCALAVSGVNHWLHFHLHFDVICLGLSPFSATLDHDCMQPDIRASVCKGISSRGILLWSNLFYRQTHQRLLKGELL